MKARIRVKSDKSFIIPINRILLKNVTPEMLIGESYKDELMEIIKHRMIS